MSEISRRLDTRASSPPDHAGELLNNDPRRDPRIEGDTPTMRLFALLEIIAGQDGFFSLQGLVDATGLPKPTVHRMLAQLEGAGIVQRDGDGRHYATGLRLRKLASQLLLNNTLHGARRLILSRLVAQVGESCNITAFSGSDVVYVDRVETDAPLRFSLHPGSRVPVHSSATGKLFLAQMTPSQRRRVLDNGPLEKFTDNTLTTLQQLEKELDTVRRNHYALDNEEYLPGLLCVAVLVPSTAGKSNMGVAIQAPIMRLTHDRALHFLPALQRAAQALAALNEDAEADHKDETGGERQAIGRTNPGVTSATNAAAHTERRTKN